MQGWLCRDQDGFVAHSPILGETEQCWVLSQERLEWQWELMFRGLVLYNAGASVSLLHACSHRDFMSKSIDNFFF